METIYNLFKEYNNVIHEIMQLFFSEDPLFNMVSLSKDDTLFESLPPMEKLSPPSYHQHQKLHESSGSSEYAHCVSVSPMEYFKTSVQHPT